MEYRSGGDGVLIAAVDALIQMARLTRSALGVKSHDPPRAATVADADQPVRPAGSFKMGYVLLFVIEPFKCLIEDRGRFAACVGRSVGYLLHDQVNVA